MRSAATIIAVIAFFSGLSIDDGLASGSTEKLTAYRTADQAGEQIDPAGFGTFDIFMGDLLKFIPLILCKIWRTIWKATICTFVEFTGQKSTHDSPAEVGIIIILNISECCTFVLVLKEIFVKGIYRFFALRIFYHALSTVNDSRLISVSHVGITEDQLALPDRSFIHELDTFAGGVYFDLANGQDNIQLGSLPSRVSMLMPGSLADIQRTPYSSRISCTL